MLATFAGAFEVLRSEGRSLTLFVPNYGAVVHAGSRRNAAASPGWLV
jgi:hypothetical protein